MNKVDISDPSLPPISSYRINQYLIQGRDSGVTLAILTLLDTSQDDFSLEAGSSESPSFSQYWDEEMPWTSSYTDVLKAIGNEGIDISDIKFVHHANIQIPYEYEDSYEISSGTIHNVCGTLFKERGMTLFSITPTWY